MQAVGGWERIIRKHHCVLITVLPGLLLWLLLSAPLLSPQTVSAIQSHWCTDSDRLSGRRARDGRQGSPSLTEEDAPGREEKGWRGKMRPLSEPLSCFALQELRGIKMIPLLSSKTSWVGCGYCCRQYNVLFGLFFQPVTLTADNVTKLSLVGPKQMMFPPPRKI